jgi:hypothetical protein
MRVAMPPLPQYTFMAWCLVKHRHNFILTLPLSPSLTIRVQFPVVTSFSFSATTVSRPVLGHSVSYPMGNGYFSLGLSRWGREDDQSSLCSAEAENAWSYTSTHTHVFMSQCLVKHRNNFCGSKCSVLGLSATDFC